MSAETIVAGPDPDACAITVTPLLPLLPLKVWTVDSEAMPVPPNVADVVRDGAQWARIVRHLLTWYTDHRDGAAALKRRRPAYRRFLKALMYLGPDHPRVGEEALARIRLRECGFCGRDFLPWHPRSRYCCAACNEGANP